MSEATKTESAFKIVVPEDRLTATVVVGEGAQVSATEIIVALREMKLAGFDDGLIIEAIEMRKTEPISVEVAKGKAAVDEKPKRVEYRVPVADGVSGTVVKVEAGQIVGTFSATTPGTDGIDVFGQPIAHKPGDSCTIGRNLAVTKDEIAATAAGNLRLSGNSLSVEPLLEFGTITTLRR